MNFPSGLKLAALMGSSCRRGSVIALPESASQMRAVLSDAVRIHRAGFDSLYQMDGGLNATKFTGPSRAIGSVRGLPVITSHTRAVLSSEPVTIHLLSGLTATARTSP